jgi:hypothetical protein
MRAHYSGLTTSFAAECDHDVSIGSTNHEQELKFDANRYALGLKFDAVRNSTSDQGGAKLVQG